MSLFEYLPAGRDYPIKPSLERYRQIMAEEAHRAGVPPVLAFGRSRVRKVAYVRYRAWQRLREMGFSYPGIAARAARHHTTVIFGVRRIAEISAREIAAMVLERRERRAPRAKKPPTPEEQLIIRELSRRGWNQHAIAKAVHRTPKTVRRTLKNEFGTVPIPPGALWTQEISRLCRACG